VAHQVDRESESDCWCPVSNGIVAYERALSTDKYAKGYDDRRYVCSTYCLAVRSAYVAPTKAREFPVLKRRAA
jgi:hypothetical protein